MPASPSPDPGVLPAARRAPGPWTLRLSPDWPLALVIGAAGALFAVSAGLVFEQAAWLACATASLMVALAVRAVRHDALRRTPQALTRLRLAADGSVSGERRDGGFWEGRLAPGCVTLGDWVLLRVRSGRAARARSLLLTPRACDPDELRRLRVALRWGLRGERGQARGTSGQVERSCRDGLDHAAPASARPRARRVGA